MCRHTQVLCLAKLFRMSFLVKVVLDQLAPLLSGLRVDKVPPSVLVVGYFLESFVNPDNSGLKLLEANMSGFDVVEFNGSVAVESLGSVVKSSGSVAAASVFSVVNELVRVLSMTWYIVAGVCKSWWSLSLCLVLLPGVSSGIGPPESVCNCDSSFQLTRDFTTDFGFLLVACHVAMTVLCWVIVGVLLLLIAVVFFKCCFLTGLFKVWKTGKSVVHSVQVATFVRIPSYSSETVGGKEGRGGPRYYGVSFVCPRRRCEHLLSWLCLPRGRVDGLGV